MLSCTVLTTWYSSESEIIKMVAPTYIDSYESTEDDAEKPISVTKKSESIWNSISHEFKLDNRSQSTQVQAEIRKLLAEKDNLVKILKSAMPYIYFIHHQTKMRGLPAELALIPVIESEFNPNDKSHKGATGLWQLMSQTAHELGVKVRSGYDGRRNVVASTKAALAYFKDLGVMFKGDWYLAIAAYNCGQVRVQSAMKKKKSNSFWNLSLPLETRLYVPKLLAVAEIVKNPKKYGVELPSVENKPYFEEVKIEKPVSLEKISKSTGVSIDALHKLNPDYTHGSKPKAEAKTLLVPIKKADEIKAQL